MGDSGKVLAVNGRGAGDLHGIRARLLFDGAPNAEVVDLERTGRLAGFKHMRRLLRDHPDALVYLESTGIAAGLPLILDARRGRRYVVSSGDPIEAFVRSMSGPILGWVFGRYERALYRKARAFVGWTPYLTGRAIELGAPSGVTIEGGVDLTAFTPPDEATRLAARARLGIPAHHLVLGVVGSVTWVERHQYCYGLELIEALQHLQRDDVTVLIVGDGTGLPVLRSKVPAHLADRAVFTGRVPAAEVASTMHALDIGFVTQTVDRLGAMRLTTKLPEYLACGVPVAMSPIPGLFDYVLAAAWALPALHPADPALHRAVAALVDGLTTEEHARRADQARRIAEARFDYAELRSRLHEFLSTLVA